MKKILLAAVAAVIFSFSGLMAQVAQNYAYITGKNYFDFNGDGRNDVFLYNSTTGAWQINYSDSSGYLYAGPGGYGSTDLDVQGADFNGDGLTDLFFFKPSNGYWSKSINQGDGTFYDYPGYLSPDWRAYISDLNADGLSDVFFYNFSSGQWYKALSYRNYLLGFDFRSGSWSAGWNLVSGSFFYDDPGDFFLYQKSINMFVRVTGTEEGFFERVIPFSSVGTEGYRMYPGQFDGRAHMEIFAYEPDSGHWAMGKSPITNYDEFEFVRQGLWSAGWGITVGRLNTDGLADLFLYSSDSGYWFKVLGATNDFQYFRGQWSAGWQVQTAHFQQAGAPDDLLLYNPNGEGYYFQVFNTGTDWVYRRGTWGPGWTVLASRSWP